ncbi:MULTISPECIES: Lpg1974 family pore-forming outer membrane protein [unclassified Yoonia]|uniref:Lpg1974 family pore-forming outer membrane protein n=1 Tax=unclassified Yoonia TaxID=2629118 RepID=UPI002AFF3217|nr:MULTISPECIES: Lpg1974 family pore-forming outer membrane protein [unclassified Yoonia]
MNSKMMMGSASTVALAVAGAQGAVAQSPAMLEGYTLNVQGGVGIIDNVWADKVEGESSEEQDKVGADETHGAFMGSLSLTRQTAPGRDMTLGLSLGGSPDNRYENTFESGGSSFTSISKNELAFAALDFELGTAIPAEIADFRWHYGVRALGTSARLSLGREADKIGGTVEAEPSLKSEFLGIGPRVGVGFTTQPAAGPNAGQYGFFGDIGASILFGDRKDTFGIRVTEDDGSGGVSSSGFSSSFSERKTVTSLDAQIGVDYYLSDNSKVSLGYQLQQFWNIDEWSDEESEADNSGPRLMQGVFIGYTTTF